MKPSYDVVAIAERVRKAHAWCGDVRVVTVDGLAGSGKTTIAALLSKELDNCPVINLDDLYEGWTQDLNVGLAERVNAWILTPLRHGLSAQHPVFDWHEGRFASWREVPHGKFLIIEGVGAGHPGIALRAAFNIWVDTAHELLYDRVVKRDGERVGEDMRAWQMIEQVFFNNYKVRENADLVVRGD
jgi:uridine kinase